MIGIYCLKNCMAENVWNPLGNLSRVIEARPSPVSSPPGQRLLTVGKMTVISGMRTAEITAGTGVMYYACCKECQQAVTPPLVTHQGQRNGPEDWPGERLRFINSGAQTSFEVLVRNL